MQLYLTHLAVNDTTELRLLELRHAPALFTLIDANRTHLRQWLPWLDANTEIEDSFNFIKSCQAQYAASSSVVLGIWWQDELVGVVGHNRIDWNARAGYPGYWLSKTASGKGIMTSACRALIDYSFNELQLNRVDIRCATGNHRSCAIPRRLGFTHEGTLRQAENLYGHYVDHHVFGLLASDWQA